MEHVVLKDSDESAVSDQLHDSVSCAEFGFSKFRMLAFWTRGAIQGCLESAGSARLVARILSCSSLIA